ncbi:MAG TPA: ABC transporter permease, partial [Thermomicrobiales bacterium]|nr:ABC transporter permease [Thermomicrobiales bacterium]
MATHGVRKAVTMSEEAPQTLGTGTVLRVAPTFRQRLLRDRWSGGSLIILALFVLIAVFAPLIAPYDPNKPDFLAIRQGPSSAHLLGTDAVGRDLLSRVIFGSRVSLSVAAVAVLISATIGIAIGSVSGFFGGWVDAVLQRITEVFMAFPSLLLIITAATALGPSLRNTMIIIGVFGWVTLSRLMRAEMLSLKEQDFVTAARAIGASTPRLIVRHLLPNASGPLIVNAVYGLRGAILAEAGLSFIGAGVPQPTASWG